MKILNKLLFASATSIIVCCQSSSIINQEGDLFTVDIDNAKSYVPDIESGLIAQNECEILQISCNTGIGAIEDLKFDKDKMVLLDNGRHTIHILNKEGVCEHEISHLGKATNEYIEITDFYATDNKVYVLDLPSLKVVEYNYEGSCLGVTNILNYWGNNLFVIEDHIFLVNQGSETNIGQYFIFEIKKDGTLVNSFIPFEKSPGLYSDKCYSNYSADSLFYANRESNTIFKIAKDFCEPFITLDYGTYNLPEKFKGLDARELMFNTNKEYEKYILGIEELQVSGDLLFVKFQTMQDNYLLVINYKNKSNVLLCKGICINSMYQIGLTHIYIDEDIIYDVYDGDLFVDLVRNLLNDGTPIDKKYLEELRIIASERAINPGDPIIIKYKIKNE